MTDARHPGPASPSDHPVNATTEEQLHEDLSGHVTVEGREGLLPLITHTVRAAGYEPASDRDTRGTVFARWYRHGWLTEPSNAVSLRRTNGEGR
jgi:hypothetical protein